MDNALTQLEKLRMECWTLCAQNAHCFFLNSKRELDFFKLADDTPRYKGKW